MPILRMEELEPRHLFSAAGFIPPTPTAAPTDPSARDGPAHVGTAQPSTTTAATACGATADRLPASESGQQSTAQIPASPNPGGSNCDAEHVLALAPSMRGDAPPPADAYGGGDRRPAAVVTIVVAQVVEQPPRDTYHEPDHDRGAVRLPATISGGGRQPESPGPDADLSTAPAEPAGGHGTSAAALPARPAANAIAPVTVSEAVSANPGPVGAGAMNLLARAERQGDSGAVAPQANADLPRSPRAGMGEPVAEPAKEPVAERVVPPPVVPEVLASLPPLDLSSLERGLQQFLARIDAPAAN